MPISITANSNTTVSIPENAASINIKLFGGGGGGEFTNQYNLASSAGANGGTTSFIGLNANGGQGGGQGGKRLGGAGGTGSQTVNWSSLGVSVNIINGSSGQLPTGGVGGTVSGYSSSNGGNGTPEQVSYFSTVTHVFNNTTNQHIVTQFSPDLSVGFESPGAADGLPCSNNLSYKHYRISFLVPYDNSSYSINVTSVCQQAAGGGTSGSFYNSGIEYKTTNGFRAWFCRSGNNGYVRCFSFVTSGSRSALLGRGGGGSAFVEATISRSQLIQSSTYRPGTSHQLIVGSGGSSGGSSAGSGTSGKAFITIILEPRITASIDDAAIIRGACTTLRWNVTGDVSNVSISPGIGVVNLSGTRQVCPTETITYTITASGLGGTAIQEVTLNVYQPPTVSLSGPESIDYGQQGTLTYRGTDVDISFVVEPSFTYRNGVASGSMFNINLPLGQISEGTISTNIPYNDYGPITATYTIVATGNGGMESKQITIPIVIDETPENFLVPESTDLFKDQDPVYTPDVTITSFEIVVDDIDIPVEIKADRPILVEVNNDEQWNDLRQI